LYGRTRAGQAATSGDFVTIMPVIDIAIAALIFWAVYLAFGHRHLLRPDLRALLRRTHVATDLCHWFANTVLFAPLWAAVGAILLAPLAGGDALAALHGAVRVLPWAAQLALALLIFDLAAYWRHRLMHSDALWPVHEVHHSSTHLNWLSGIRNHPLNTLAIHLVGAAVIVTFGFAPDIAAIVGLIRFYWVCFVHSDIRLHLGPLNYVIVTPDFHRWHHVPDGIRHRNYAGFFSFIDLAFGTFHFPRDRRAAIFGPGAADYPQQYPAQLIAPFRAWARTLAHRAGRVLATGDRQGP